MKIKNTDVEAQHPWPDDCAVQGGAGGIVFTKTGSYTTAFVEAFPGTFIRGEGPTIQEAEDSAWAQYERRIQCPGHEWEARNYKNGAGFCIHCGTFGSQVFTPEDLGLSCKVCGIPTYWSREITDEGEFFYCPEHAMDRDSVWHRENSTGSQIGDLLGTLEALAKEAE